MAHSITVHNGAFVKIYNVKATIFKFKRYSMKDIVVFSSLNFSIFFYFHFISTMAYSCKTIVIEYSLFMQKPFNIITRSTICIYIRTVAVRNDSIFILPRLLLFVCQHFFTIDTRRHNKNWKNFFFVRMVLLSNRDSCEL